MSSHPGFGRALYRTLSELRLARVTPDMLAPHDPDLARIAAAFEAALVERSLVDLASLYELATERARTLRLPALLFFDVPIAHAAEAELVRALAAQSDRACATIPLGDTKSLDAFRAALPQATEHIAAPRAEGELGRLQAHLFERDLSAKIPVPGSLDTTSAAPLPEEVRNPEPPPRTRSSRSQKRSPPQNTSAQTDLFATLDASAQTELFAPSDTASDNVEGAAVAASERRVHFVSSPGESRECVEVARAVLDAARGGVTFDRMAVLCGRSITIDRSSRRRWSAQRSLRTTRQACVALHLKVARSLCSCAARTAACRCGGLLNICRWA